MGLSSRSSVVALLLGLSACGPGSLGGSGDGDEVGDSESTTISDGNGSTDTTTESSSSDTTTESTDTDTAGETDPGPVCGNGLVEGEEKCDDGNTLDGDGCSADCAIPIAWCGNKIYACGDTLDNDDDGLVDLYDPECSSPCDDDEGSFDTQLPSNSDCKYECGWDSNEGSGDDQCETNLICDPLSPGAAFACVYDPDFLNCPQQQPPNCLETCLPMTPNGCDCFGCCEIAGEFRYLGQNTSCESEALADCLPCTPHLECFNPCEAEACELCLLDEVDALPDECDGPACPPGVGACLGPYDCGEGERCQTGCCVAISVF